MNGNIFYTGSLEERADELDWEKEAKVDEAEESQADLRRKYGEVV